LGKAFLPGVLLALAGRLPGAAQTAPPDTLAPTLEIAYEAGPLQLAGGAPDGKVRWTAPASWGKEKDSLLAYLPETKRNKLFVRAAAREKVKDTKEALRVTLPAKGPVEVRTGKGPVSVSSLQGSLRADAESGPITLEALGGPLYAYTREGAVTVRASKVSGTVGTGKGDVLIENTEGPLTGFSRQGKVVTRFTKAYLQGKTTPFEADLDQTDLEVEALPAGGSLRVRKGSVLVQEAAGGVQARTQEGDITLEKASGNVTASTGKGHLHCALTGRLTYVDLSSEGGDVTVSLPAAFDGTLLLEQEQSGAGKGTYQLTSGFALGEVKAEAVTGAKGETLARVTRLEKRIGTGGAVVRIRTVNGNLTILKK
jgi:DUF4097 and DUF4098 domain-containing protein YvlB